MPRPQNTLRAVSAFALFLFLWAGCDSADPVPPAASVTLTADQSFVPVGESVRVAAVARDAAGQSVTTPVQWRSEAPSIATVDSEGVVRGQSEGVATIVATAGGVSGQVAITVVAAGTLVRSFNVATEEACSDADNRSFRRVATSARAEIWADLQNPTGGFTDAEYQELAQEFDRVAWPAVVGTFGEPSDIDATGRVHILYTRAVNELTERDSDSFVGGFFFGRDLFPRQSTPRLGACPTSNQAEMFYMLVPDPQGEVNNNVRRKADVRRGTVNTLTHELQHLVNASRRLFVNNASVFEETWLDEGLSHVVEELAFYNESGLGPQSNITIEELRASQAILDAVNRYAVQNLARISIYLEEPQAHSPFNVNDRLETRGSAWQLLRYAADQPSRNASTFFRSLGNSTSSGVDNLALVLGEPVLPVARTWAVGTHLDDAAPGIPERFQHRSWNFRSVLAALSRNDGRYPLQIVTLPNGVERSTGVLAGSAAHFRFASASSAPVRISLALGAGSSSGGSCEPPQTITLGIGEVRELDVAAATVLCLSGPTGAEYGLVAFHNAGPGPRPSQGNRPPLANLVAAVRADGVATPTVTAAANRVAAGPLLQAYGLPGPRSHARDWEVRLRERERRELTPLIRGGTVSAPAPMLRAAGATAPLQVTVARLR